MQKLAPSEADEKRKAKTYVVRSLHFSNHALMQNCRN